jgi:hypothetical protein
MSIWFYVYDGEIYYFGLTSDGRPTGAYTSETRAGSELASMERETNEVSDDAIGSLVARQALLALDRVYDPKTKRERPISFLNDHLIVQPSHVSGTVFLFPVPCGQCAGTFSSVEVAASAGKELEFARRPK